MDEVVNKEARHGKSDGEDRPSAAPGAAGASFPTEQSKTSREEMEESVSGDSSKEKITVLIFIKASGRS